MAKTNTGRFKRGYKPWNINILGYKIKYPVKRKLKGSLSELCKQNISKSVPKGSQHSNWKGGIYPLNEAIRKLLKYRQWRSDVFTRDNFTCQICGLRGTKIEADHFPKRFSVIIQENNISSLDEALNCEELWNLNNGRVLCVACHRPTTGRSGSGGQDRRQNI